MTRPTWTEYYIGLAYTVSKRATCPVRSVGAVFVNPLTNAVLSMGYNGSPRGTQHCGEDCANREMGESREVCRAVHAEANAIYNAAQNGVKLDGTHCYLTISPCVPCAKALIQVGVRSVTYAEIYKHTEGIDMLIEGGIPNWQHILKPWWDEHEEIEFISAPQ